MKYVSQRARLFSAMAILLLLILSAAGVPSSVTAEFGAQEGETGTISGTVTDNVTADPVGMVYVFVYDLDLNWVGDDTTDTAGYYEIGNLPAGLYLVDFTVGTGLYKEEWYHDAASYVTAQQVSVTSGGTTTIDESLVPWGRIAGTVTDASTSGPIAGISVYVRDGSQTLMGQDTTDADGSYLVTGLNPGSYKVNFFDASRTYAGEWYDNAAVFATATPVAVTLGEVTVDEDLWLGCTISGTVTDALSSTPIPSGISVSVWDLGHNQVGFALPADGHYEVKGLPPGSCKVWFQDDLGGSGIYVSEWYDDAQGWGSFDSAQVVTLTAPGDNVTVDEDLWPGQATLAGRVTCENETGIANAYVAVYGPAEAETFTDGEGYYTFPGLYCGTYELSVFPPYGVNVLPGFTNAVLVQSGTTVDFTLLDGGIISGRVTDEVGTGVADALVYAPDGYANSDPDGYYSIVGLPSGNWTVMAAPPWDVNLLSGTATAEVVEGSTTTVDFVLPPGGIISGRVTDPADAGVPDTWVAADGPDSRGDYSDADGYYSIVGLVGGGYTVTASPPYGSQLLNGSGSAIVVENTTATVDFALLLEGVIAGQVTNSYNGSGVPGVSLFFTGPDSHFATTTTDNSGYYYVPQCISGNWTISATPPPGLELLPGNASAEVTNGATTTVDFVLQSNDITPPPVPILVSPSNEILASDNTPWLDWSDVTDPSGVHYEIQVDNDAGFTSPEFARTWVSASSCVIATELPGGAYYWRVRAADGLGNTGDWTSAWSFTVHTTIPAVPALVTPDNGKVVSDNTPWLDWSDVTDPLGVHYEIQVDDDAGFTSPEFARTWVSASSCVVTTELSEAMYYWKVRAVDGDGYASAWTSAWSFSVHLTIPSAPTLLTPANAKLVSDNTPYLDWSDASDPSGVHYELQVDNNGGFTSLDFSRTWVNASSCVVSTELPNGTYNWRVRAVDGDGYGSAWASARSFTVDSTAPSVPALVSPASGKATTDPTPWVDWSSVSDASGVYYQIQVDNDAGFTSLEFNRTSVSSSSCVVNTELADGTYSWRVRAVDGAGNTSAWTAAWSLVIDTTAPSVPVLTNPADGGVTTDTTPYVDWSDATDATAVHYQVQVDNDAGFTSLEFNRTWVNASSCVVTTVLSPGTYYWRVRAVDAAGNTSAWTGAWTFTIA